MPHIKALIARGAIDAVVSYGEPVAADGTADRKAMTKLLEGAVRTITTATLRGRPRPAHPLSSVLSNNATKSDIWIGANKLRHDRLHSVYMVRTRAA